MNLVGILKFWNKTYKNYKIYINQTCINSKIPIIFLRTGNKLFLFSADIKTDSTNEILKMFIFQERKKLKLSKVLQL